MDKVQPDNVICKYRSLLTNVHLQNHSIARDIGEMRTSAQKKLSSTRKQSDGHNYHHTPPSKLHKVGTALAVLTHQ